LRCFAATARQAKLRSFVAVKAASPKPALAKAGGYRLDRSYAWRCQSSPVRGQSSLPRSSRPDPFDDGRQALSLFGVADLLHAAFEVAEHAVYLPRRLSFRHDLVRQLLGLVGLTEVEGCPKQRWTQPVVGQIQPLGALAGGDHQPQRSLRALFVA